MFLLFVLFLSRELLKSLLLSYTDAVKRLRHAISTKPRRLMLLKQEAIHKNSQWAGEKRDCHMRRKTATALISWRRLMKERKKHTPENTFTLSKTDQQAATVAREGAGPTICNASDWANTWLVQDESAKSVSKRAPTRGRLRMSFFPLLRVARKVLYYVKGRVEKAETGGLGFTGVFGKHLRSPAATTPEWITAQ